MGLRAKARQVRRPVNHGMVAVSPQRLPENSVGIERFCSCGGVRRRTVPHRSIASPLPPMDVRQFPRVPFDQSWKWWPRHTLRIATMRREGSERAVRLDVETDNLPPTVGSTNVRASAQQPSFVRWVLNSGGRGGTEGAMIECLVPPQFFIRTRPFRAVCPARSAPVNPGPPSAEKTKTTTPAATPASMPAAGPQRPNSIGRGRAAASCPLPASRCSARPHEPRPTAPLACPTAIDYRRFRFGLEAPTGPCCSLLEEHEPADGLRCPTTWLGARRLLERPVDAVVRGLGRDECCRLQRQRFSACSELMHRLRRRQSSGASASLVLDVTRSGGGPGGTSRIVPCAHNV